MKTLKILTFSALITLLFSAATKPAKADGGIFYPRDYYSAETTQKAFIYFADQTENMVVLASFKGNAKDFVWVIPTPSEPEINKGSVDLFNTLASITKLTETGPDVVYNQGLLGVGAGAPKSPPVEVISEKTVDVFDTVVLKATDENALAKWLSDHGYSFPEDQSSNLKSYVDDGWYFAIAKINSNIVSGGGIVPQLEEGTLTPLRLTFQTDKIIYPMKLTGIALAQSASPAMILPPMDNPTNQEPFNMFRIPITLYVLSDHKTEQSMLTTIWANWVSKSDIQTLNHDLEANIISGQKLFLTKMDSTVDVRDITDDFIITSASNDTVYPEPRYTMPGFWLENLLVLVLVPLAFVFSPLPLGLIFIVFVILQTHIKKKWLYILGNIYEVFTCFIPLAVWAVILLANDFNLAKLWLENGFIGGLISSTALEVAIIYFTARMIKRYKKVFSTPV